MQISSADDVHRVLGAPASSAALAAALEHGVFWMLHEGPRPVASIAQELDVPAGRCRWWLEALVALGVLQGGEDGYELSPAGRSAILDAGSREAWRYLAQEARESSHLFVDLAPRLGRRGPVTDDPAAITDYVEKLRADPDRARRFTEMLFELHGWLGDAVAEVVNLGGARTLLDIGGGSGVMSLALLRRNPDLTATVVDMPAVCRTGRAIADRTAEASRITYLPLDYMTDDLPTGSDVVMTCDARFDPPLLSRIADVMPEGGRYLLVDRSFDTGPMQRAVLARGEFRSSLIDPDHALPTIEQVYDDLRAAGLEPAPYVELTKPLWKVIEARKRGNRPPHA